MRCAQLSSGWSVKKLIWKDSCTKFLFTVNFFPSHSITNTVPEMCRHHTESSWSKNSPRATSLRLSIFFFFVVVRLFPFFFFITMSLWLRENIRASITDCWQRCYVHHFLALHIPHKSLVLLLKITIPPFTFFFFFHFGSKEEIYERRKTFGLCFPNPARQITTCWRGCMGL